MTMIRKTLFGLAVAAIVAAAPPAALAHAAYKSSDPADRSTVASPPSRVTAEFTEPLTDSSSLSVFDPCGNQVDNGDSSPRGYEMSVTMSADKAGRYTVQFQAQSALDSHVTSGSFTFTSSGGDPCPGSEPPPEPKTGGGSGSDGGGSGDGTEPAPGGGTSQAGADPGGSAGAVGNDGSGGGAPAKAGTGRSERPGRGARSGGGSRTGSPVAFQPARDRAPDEPAPWDLPLSGVVMAFVLCVLIGAAGGRVYAGIVAPPRR